MAEPNEEEKTALAQLKNNVIYNTEMKGVKMRGNTTKRETRHGKFGFSIYLPKHEREIWEKEVNKRDLDRSSLIRAYATVGRKVLQEHSPAKKASSEVSTTDELIKQNVPRGNSSAKSIDKIVDLVVKDIEQLVMQTLAKDEQIQQNEEQFYRNQ